MNEPPAGSEQVFVNVPDRYRALGWAGWREAVRGLWSAREIAWWLTRREVLSRYRQSFLGLGWAVITPAATVVVFWFLQRSRLLQSPDPQLPYPLFVYAGLLPWQLFQAGVVRGAHALVGAPALVGRVRFPRELLVVTALGSASLDFAVGLLPFVVLAAVSGAAPAWTAPAALVPLFGLVLLAFGVGLLLSVLNAITRDLGRVIQPAMMLWLFLTPVFYAPATEGPGRWLSWLNPAAPCVHAFRELLFLGEVSQPGALATSFAVALLVLAGGWRVFQVSVARAAEVV